jgi:hypothetical protein
VSRRSENNESYRQITRSEISRRNQRQAKRKLAKYEMKMKRRRICAAGGEMEGAMGRRRRGGINRLAAASAAVAAASHQLKAAVAKASWQPMAAKMKAASWRRKRNQWRRGGIGVKYGAKWRLAASAAQAGWRRERQPESWRRVAKAASPEISRNPASAEKRKMKADLNISAASGQRVASVAANTAAKAMKRRVVSKRRSVAKREINGRMKIVPQLAKCSSGGGQHCGIAAAVVSMA